MRHAADGELHAYLDGALDLLPEGRGDEIRDHLAHCPVCAERLQDEERIRDRAQDLLAAAAPVPVGVPSFEELRALAEAKVANEERAPSPAVGRIPTRGPLRGIPLAWAATVVLALGVGWMGGGLWRSLPDSSRRGPAEAGRPEGVGIAPVEPALGAGPARLDLSTEGEVQAPAPVSPRAPREGDEAGAAGPPLQTRIPPVVEEAEKVPARQEQAASAFQAQRSAPGLAGRSTENLLERRAGAATPMVAPAADQDREPALRLKALPRESSLAVPGHQLLSVEWEEWVVGERALHIRQLLPTGDTLELRYLGLLLGADPEAEGRAADLRDAPETGVERPPSPAVLEASLRPGWNQVEMRWGKGWLVARAPLSEDAIRMLLRSIQ